MMMMMKERLTKKELEVLYELHDYQEEHQEFTHEELLKVRVFVAFNKEFNLEHIREYLRGERILNPYRRREAKVLDIIING